MKVRAGALGEIRANILTYSHIDSFSLKSRPRGGAEGAFGFTRYVAPEPGQPGKWGFESRPRNYFHYISRNVGVLLVAQDDGVSGAGAASFVRRRSGRSLRPMTCLVWCSIPDRHQRNNHGPPSSEQDISYGVRHGVTQCGNTASRFILNRAKSGCNRPSASTGTEDD